MPCIILLSLILTIIIIAIMSLFSLMTAQLYLSTLCETGNIGNILLNPLELLCKGGGMN